MARLIADKSSSLGRFVAVKEIAPSVWLWRGTDRDVCNDVDRHLWVVAREGEAVGTARIPVFDTPEAAELSWELSPRQRPLSAAEALSLSMSQTRESIAANVLNKSFGGSNV